MPARLLSASALVAVVVTLALALALVACADDSTGAGPSTTAPPPATAAPTVAPAPAPTIAPSAAAPARTPLPGFDVVAVRFLAADGSIVEGCVLLADDAASRSQGLMEVTDPTLGGHDGMLFTFSAPTTSSFYMLNTPLPLTLAFFDGDRFVSSLDMAPCPNADDEPRCPRYAPDAPYTQALEVPQGRLAALGVGPGARLEVGGTCPPPAG